MNESDKKKLFVVPEYLNGSKLFRIGRIAFPQFSKRDLRALILNGNILIDRINTSSEKDEYLKVNSSSVIEVCLESKEQFYSITEANMESLDILATTLDYVVMIKPCGISAGINKPLDRQIMAHMQMCFVQDPDTPTAFELLYRPEKGLTSVLLCAANSSSTHLLKQQFLSGDLQLTYCCIVCGRPENGPLHIQFGGYEHILCLTVRQVSRCRSHGYLSMIEFRLSLPSAVTDTIDDKPLCGPLSAHIKSIRRILNKSGFPIVGDQKLVKKSKGIFAILSKVTLHDKPDSISYELDIPAKFTKLMEREERFWELNRQRESDLVNTSLQLERLSLNEENNDNSEESENKYSSDESLDDGELKKEESALQPPVEYLLGQAQFRGLTFHVNPSVMIPRRSSEILVETAVESASAWLRDPQNNGKTLHILDLGTGSGCLLLSTLSELLRVHGPTTNVCGVGIDISSAALLVAKSNCEALGLFSLCSFRELSYESLQELRILFAPDQQQQTKYQGPIFSVVLCNPPYSSKKERSRLSAATRQFEPAQALFNVGGGPLDSYRTLAASLTSLTQPLPDWIFSSSTTFIFEVGHGQHQQVESIFKDKGLFSLVESRRDFKRILRCLVFQSAAQITYDS